MSIAVIKPQEFAELSNKGQEIDLIDVRTPVEFREVHVDFARNVPVDQIDPAALIKARYLAANEPYYVICRSGSRGQQACEKFLKAGFSNVVNIEGGTEAWVAAGLPVVRGKKAMSLERQVRIAAGSIVLTGAVAAMVTENVYLAGIPAFIGAGLMFAGITDSCAMGILISKMPWNQVNDDGSCCTVK